MRILGVDYGDRRIGLAVSDELGITAHGLPTANVRSMDDAVRHVVDIVPQREIKRVVVGLPLNMDGSFGPRAEATLRFCEKLRAMLAQRGLSAPVETFDERLTTMRARHALHEMGFAERKQRSRVDQVSAVLLLQDFLQANAAGEAGR